MPLKAAVLKARIYPPRERKIPQPLDAVSRQTLIWGTPQKPPQLMVKGTRYHR
jgi:hypothetical protein